MFTNFELYLIDSLYSFVSDDCKTIDFEYQYIFIKNDLNSYINHTSLENVYYDIICTYDIDDINKAKNMIKNILYYYFLANPNESLNIDLLVNKFLSDEEFGIKVLKTFYLAIFNLNQLEIMENNYRKSRGKHSQSFCPASCFRPRNPCNPMTWQKKQQPRR